MTSDATTERDYLTELAEAVAKRERAREHYAKKAAAVRLLIREAQESGVPMTRVSKAAGISRARAYRVLHAAGGIVGAPVGRQKGKALDPLMVEGLD